MRSDEGRIGRGEFLRAGLVGVTGALVAGGVGAAEPSGERAAARNVLPRWRGFNLLDFFQAFSLDPDVSGMMIPEDDLRWMRDWGFDFARLPMDYWLWIDGDWRKTRKIAPGDMGKIREASLEKVDLAVDLCGRYGLHLNLNFHRAPGYCINEREPKRESFSLWNLRGTFGVLDSGRTDVAYADWHGHKLDRAMLDLLRRM